MTDDLEPLHLKTKPYLIPLLIAVNDYARVSIGPEDVAKMREFVTRHSNGTDMDHFKWLVAHMISLEKQVKFIEDKDGE